MAAIYTKRRLSGRVDGLQIKVGAITTPGTLIHTAVTGTTEFDEIWIYATNTDAADRILTLEWGETAIDGNIVLTVPAKNGLLFVTPGLLLQNSLVVRAFCTTGDVVMISGFVNRITP